MIKNCKDKITLAIFNRLIVRGIDEQLQRKMYKKLLMVNSAAQLEDLRVPPGNRLEKKKGKMKGLHCIRVNDQWRVCFRWDNGDAYDVILIDYH
ncbi:MAG: type II toxin-antitoxin system RelE/ParE family toxin [Candidatus Thiodiazotropha endolucinida]